MSGYRDDVAALLERIELLEQELADARGTTTEAAEASQSAPRCPYCKVPMVPGKLDAQARFGGATGVLDLVFGKDGGDQHAVDRYAAPLADWFCEDCCTVIVRGRFAH